MLPLAVLLLWASARDTSKTIVPTLGRVAGIVLGHTTVQEFEAMHGKGLRYIADGDPRKARGFYLWIACCTIEHHKLD